MRLTWTKVIAGALALVSATATATWWVREDRVQQLQAQVNLLIDSQDFPQTTRDLLDASQTLQNTVLKIKEFEETLIENEKLKTVHDQNEAQIEYLQGELIQLNQKNETHLADLHAEFESEKARLQGGIAALEKRLASIFPDLVEFDLRKGEAESFDEYGIRIGIKYVSSDTVDVIYNNEEKRVGAGYTFHQQVEKKNCNVTLIRIANFEVASFRLTCRG